MQEGPVKALQYAGISDGFASIVFGSKNATQYFSIR
jgi:hypothetical protein